MEKQTLVANQQDSIEHKRNSRVSNVEPIRVLFVMDKIGYPGGVSHGPAHYIRNVFPRFDQALVNSHLCVLSPRHPFAEQLEAAGVRPLFLNRQKWDPRCLTDLIGLIHQHNIEVVLLAGMKACLVGRLAARATGTRTILHVPDMNPMGSILRFMQRRLAGWTDLAIAISQPVRDYVIEEMRVSKDRTEVMNYPVVISDFSNPSPQARNRIRSELGIKEQAGVIGLIGRISPEKGHKFLIQIMPSIVASCPNAVLLVVGDGPTREECEALTRTLGLGDAISFCGYRKDISEVLAAVDVVAMPSEREGFGLAALEAITAGKPVVATRVGGLPEIIIDGETGFLVELNDQTGLARALLQLLKDPQRLARQREACRHHAQKFAVEKHVKLLENLYWRLARPCHIH